jgi:hypothetical protein
VGAEAGCPKCAKYCDGIIGQLKPSKHVRPGAPYAGFACGLLLLIVVARPARHRRASIVPGAPYADLACGLFPLTSGHGFNRAAGCPILAGLVHARVGLRPRAPLSVCEGGLFPLTSGHGFNRAATQPSPLVILSKAKNSSRPTTSTVIPTGAGRFSLTHTLCARPAQRRDPGKDPGGLCGGSEAAHSGGRPADFFGCRGV